MTYPVRQNTDTMKKIILIYILCLSGVVCPARSSLKVFQLNLWNATTNVPGSEEGTVRTLKDIDADIVLLCEATTGKDTSLVRRIADRLSADGLHYYLSGAGHPVCMLTKEKPEKAEWTCIIPGNEERAILKVTLDIDGRPFAIYSAHLDHRNYQCYMPRGYSGSSWKKIDGPITDEAAILEANRKSYRDESIRAFIEESAKDLAEGKTVIIGGDFNEPSHLDWGESTSGLRDHNGATVRWDCSAMLEEAGFTDAYREKHPDPVTWPGITYPAGNEEARKAAGDSGNLQSFHAIMREVLDYRQWFEFQLECQKTGEKRRELTDRVFFTFSGGEKAMAMYVPLFSAVVAKYAGARQDAPRLISLDEAFAGVDEMNIRDMFRLMVEFDFNFMINSQILWGDYDTVPALAIYQLVRPENAKYVTVIPYIWNGKVKSMVNTVR